MWNILLLLYCITNAPSNAAFRLIEKRSLLQAIEYTVLDWNTIEHFEWKLVPDKHNHNLLNGNLSFRQDVSDAIAKIVMKYESNQKYEVLSATDFDYCQSLKQKESNAYLRYFARQILRVGNFPMECPFLKKYIYYIKDYDNTKLPTPAYFPEVNWLIGADFYINKVRAATINLTGKVVQLSSNIK